MKKILLIFLLSATGIMAQVNYTVSKYTADDRRGVYVSDSLWTTGWVDTSATPDDTLSARVSKKIELNFAFDWALIELVDTGATFDDSVTVETGIVETASGVEGDTTWYNVPLRDTTWTIVNGVLVDDNSRHLYATYYPLGVAMRIRMTNTQAVYSRVHYFNINFIKKEKEN